MSFATHKEFEAEFSDFLFMFRLFSSSTFSRQQNNCDSKPCVFSIVLDFLMKNNKYQHADFEVFLLLLFLMFLLLFAFLRMRENRVCFYFILNLKSWRLKCFIFDFTLPFFQIYF